MCWYTETIRNIPHHIGNWFLHTHKSDLPALNIASTTQPQCDLLLMATEKKKHWSLKFFALLIKDREKV